MILSVAQGVESLKQGSVVAIPTETVYGLAARIDRLDSIAQIFSAKQRPFFDPLIVHISKVEELGRLVSEVPENAQKLIEKFWPGPLTLILPKSDVVSELITSGLPTVAVRLPAHPVAQAIIAKLGAPVAAPSANLFGRISPTTAEAVLEQLAGRIGGVVDGGPCEVGLESTIVSFWNGKQTLMRPGGIPREQIEALIGPLEKPLQSANNSIAAPGMLPRHYSPQTKMEVVSAQNLPKVLAQQKSGARIGILGYALETIPQAHKTLDLSKSGSLVEAAANLYKYMRLLDAETLDCIYAVAVPEEGLGIAINDRIRRAACPKE